jgi:aspartate 1-decarboxylase
MWIQILKSKLHLATVTEACVDYEGSMTISQDLMDLCGILPYEKVLCGNMANGSRFETYAIPGESGKGEIILNGATAHLGNVGDRLTIMTFANMAQEEARIWTPKVLVLNTTNQIIKRRGINEPD